VDKINLFTSLKLFIAYILLYVCETEMGGQRGGGTSNGGMAPLDPLWRRHGRQSCTVGLVVRTVMMTA